ncbi:DUF3290 family protein [Fusobacterium sp.]|uniref:DUF3290 family protein n=1 Tax=Fusobacterium sp. TaxID=68766 RepID=UPI002901A309|nr:DUF3290 family protein [Fusobacterium sp.]MDU1909754.1 DUF3290 family protein [Fusobacterium sp.]
MLFYTYQYFENQSKINNIFKYLIGLFILLFFFFTIIKYLQNRLSSKYRDLIIISILSIILMLGIEYTHYNRSKTVSVQTSQAVYFLKELSKEENIPIEKILANSTYLYNGMIIKMDKDYYRVNFNNSFQFYSLDKVKLLNLNIEIIDK